MKQLLLLSLIVFDGCSSNLMSKKDITETFQPILDFMEYKPGMTFADVGAGSGAITVSMTVLMRQSTIYIQDIDTTVLSERKVNKYIDLYSKETRQDLRATNTFHITIGGIKQTNLPDQSLDRIYSNATVHCFTEFDAMVSDMGKKLKPGGMLFVRDSFRGDHNEAEYCSDPKCGNRLLTIDEFLTAMKKNGFELVKQNPDMSGYPVFGFKLAL